MIQVVILAAGFGSRLDSPSKMPKALTQLYNGETILSFQLQQLSKYIPISQLLIVIGYRFEEIVKVFPNLTYCYNNNFASENTAGSLRRALKHIENHLLFLNGDVIFHPYVIKALLNYGDSAMLVNEEQVGDEEVKYRKNENDYITAVSKTVLDPEGEAVGVNFIHKRDLPAFKRNLEKCDDKEYFEKAFEYCIYEGLKVKAIPALPDYCCEIDYLEDLQRANKLIEKWSGLTF